MHYNFSSLDNWEQVWDFVSTCVYVSPPFLFATAFERCSFVLLTAFTSVPKIVTGKRIYNFWSANTTCCFWEFSFDITQHYFDNCTLLRAMSAVSPSTNATALWVGSLDTQSVFHRRQTFNLISDFRSGFPLSYYADNVLPGPTSEIMERTRLEQVKPRASLFDVPSYCREPCQLAKQRGRD
jgi:hypothetical protein